MHPPRLSGGAPTRLLRWLPDPWKDRPELRSLARAASGTLDSALARPDFDRVRILHTQDVDGLRANAPRLAHLRALEVSGSLGLGDAILELGALSNLEHLALQQRTYGSGTATLSIRKLLAAPHLQKLRALSRYGYTLSADDLDALASCDQPLRFLRLQYAGMKPAFGAKLAKVAARKKLERLDLKYNVLGPKAAVALFANGGDWSALEVLDFSANEIGPRGVAAICGADVRSKAEFLSSVRVLNAESIADAEYGPLFACPHLGSLEILGLGGCYTDHTDPDKAFEALVTAKPPPKLRYVDLNGWKLTVDQAKRFATSPLGRHVWGIGVMSMYVPPETWRVFYEAGLPLVDHSVFFCDPASENRSLTTFREEIGCR